MLDMKAANNNKHTILTQDIWKHKLLLVRGFTVQYLPLLPPPRRMALPLAAAAWVEAPWSTYQTLTSLSFSSCHQQWMLCSSSPLSPPVQIVHISGLTLTEYKLPTLPLLCLLNISATKNHSPRATYDRLLS